MKKKKRIDFILLWKKLFGKLDDRDKAALDAWLEAGPENQELLDKLDTFQQAPRKISNEQRDQAWHRLKSGLDTTPVRRWADPSYYNWKVLYRAAAVLLIATTVLLWNFPRREAKPISQVTIAPGRARATLITPGGNHIALGDSLVNLSQHGIPAQVAGTTLTYATTAASQAAEEINTLIIPRGGEFQLTLADGTRVWLNAESTIRYPAQFTGALRWVELTGEAYFEVTKNKERPFQVSTPGQTIAVLGTSFNVTAYPEEAQTLTTLVEGEIAVKLDEGATLRVTPGYQSVFDAAAGTLSTRKVDTDLYTSWKDGVFIFEDEKLANILTRLGRWYDVDIAYANAHQKEARFTAHVDKYQSATEVLKLIQVTGAVTFEADRETIIVK
jgi:transmembrane sensor